MISKTSFIGQYTQDFESQYLTIKELGSGTYGTVFRVQSILTRTFFACKKINKRKIRNRERFKTEIELLKITDHPHIVKLFEIWEDHVYLYLIMEELAGGEFFERLAARAKSHNLYSESEAARIFKQLMSALNYLHRHGVSHRDIKPENLIFESMAEDANLKIIDFGLSKVFDQELRHMSSILGTSFYMAPEVVKGHYDERCDVWSAGVILYIMMCGRPPFYAQSDEKVLKKILEKDYSFDYPEWANVSESVKNLIKSIFVDQEQRLTAAEVLEHPWLKKDEIDNRSQHRTGLELDWEHILSYSKMDKMTKYAISFLGFRMKTEDIKSLTQIFERLDKHSDGVLTVSNMKEGLQIAREKNQLTISDREFADLFKDIDLDHNGWISYNEFISATVEINPKVKKEHIYELFRNLDDNCNGKLSFEEIVNHIKPKTEEEQENLSKVFAILDKNGDKDIDFEEFIASLESLYDNKIVN